MNDSHARRLAEATKIIIGVSVSGVVLLALVVAVLVYKSYKNDKLNQFETNKLIENDKLIFDHIKACKNKNSTNVKMFETNKLIENDKPNQIKTNKLIENDQPNQVKTSKLIENDKLLFDHIEACKNKNPMNVKMFETNKLIENDKLLFDHIKARENKNSTNVKMIVLNKILESLSNFAKEPSPSSSQKLVFITYAFDMYYPCGISKGDISIEAGLYKSVDFTYLVEKLNDMVRTMCELASEFRQKDMNELTILYEQQIEKFKNSFVHSNSILS